MSDPGEIVHVCQQEGQLHAQKASANICLFVSPKHQCSKHTTVETEDIIAVIKLGKEDFYLAKRIKIPWFYSSSSSEHEVNQQPIRSQDLREKRTKSPSIKRAKPI